MPDKLDRWVIAALGAAVSLSLTMCGGGGGSGEGGTGTTTGCPNGICGGGGKTTTSGGTTGSSGTTGTGGTGTTTGTGGTGNSTTNSTSTIPSGCAWACTPWDTGGNGDMATRTCVDTNNCGTNKPAETATLPALDLNYFKCNVEPILDKKCSMIGCHGTETGRALRVYARGRHREANSTITSSFCAGSSTGTNCIAANSCPCNGPHTAIEWQRNYDSTRGFGLDDNGNPVSDGTQSDLILQAVVGGKAHAAVHLFKNGDADFTTIVNWVNGATLPSCNTGNN